MKGFWFLVFHGYATTQLATQLQQRCIQVACSNKEARKGFIQGPVFDFVFGWRDFLSLPPPPFAVTLFPDIYEPDFSENTPI